MTHEQQMKEIEAFCEYMKIKVEKPEIVLESKDLVDELACELANCMRDFVVKKEALRMNPILAVSVGQRAFNMMSFIIMPGWCFDAVGGEWLRKDRLKLVKHITE